MSSGYSFRLGIYLKPDPNGDRHFDVKPNKNYLFVTGDFHVLFALSMQVVGMVATGMTVISWLSRK
jgi:hypothetical protein